MTAPRRARVIMVAVIVAAGAGAVSLQARRPPVAAVAVGAGDADTGSVAGPATRSSAWYCAAGGAGTPGGSAVESIVVANAGRAVVTALVEPVGGRTTPAFVRVDVGPRSRSVVKIADIPSATEAGVIVETFGGFIAVEHQLETGKDFATLPCTRRASDRWYFAAGSTGRDAKEVLALFNPFFDDAVVDLSFVTDDGPKRPPALRGLVVAARSRVNVVVNDHVPRQEHVATAIKTRRGRIVAERTLAFDASNGRAGYAATLGQPALTRLAQFGEGQAADGVNESVVIFNPSDTDADVSVRVHLDGDQVLAPKDVAIAGQSSVTVDLGSFVPKPLGHAIDVVSDRPVAVEQMLSSRAPAPRVGLEIVGPAPAPARQWLFASGQADSVRDEWITLWNTGPRPARARVVVLAAGQALVPEKLDALVVAAGKRMVVRLGDSLQRSDTPLVIDADGPLIAMRGIYGDGFSLAAGAPLRSAVIARR